MGVGEETAGRRRPPPLNRILLFRAARIFDLTLGFLPSGRTSGPGKASLSDVSKKSPGPEMSLSPTSAAGVGSVGLTNLIFFLGFLTRLPCLFLGFSPNRFLWRFLARSDLTLGGRPSGLTWGCLKAGLCGLPRLSKDVNLLVDLLLLNLFFFLLLAKMFDLTLGGRLVVVVTPMGIAVVEDGGGGLKGLALLLFWKPPPS